MLSLPKPAIRSQVVRSSVVFPAAIWLAGAELDQLPAATSAESYF